MSYVTGDTSLPRSLDVQVSLSRAQAEVRTDLSILCVAAEDLGLWPDANRVRFYSSIEAVEVDYAAGSEAHFAATAFFAQSPRAQRMAIGEVYLSDQPAYLGSAILSTAEIAAIEAVSDGSMDVVYDLGAGGGSQTFNFIGLDFTGMTTIEQIVAELQAAAPYGSAVTVALKTLPGGTKHITITVDAVGDGVLVSYPVAAIGGTFVGALLNLTSAENGKRFLGYDTEGIGGELTNIFNAANQAGEFIYGWNLGASLREVSIQTSAAVWALARSKAMMVLVTNDITALDPAVDIDIGSVIDATDNKRVVCIYHDNVQNYPDVSILALMLSVNYRLKDSALTAKFKQLPGISTVTIAETELLAAEAKGYNVYTSIGNTARTYREGTTHSDSWFMDSVINLDNFVEDLEVALLNVFLRNSKVPYTTKGQALLVDACEDVGNQYTYNGTFANREVADTTKKSGVDVKPSYLVEPTPVSQASVSDRASRVGPPIAMTVYEAGAIHSVAVNVEVIS